MSVGSAGSGFLGSDLLQFVHPDIQFEVHLEVQSQVGIGGGSSRCGGNPVVRRELRQGQVPGPVVL